MLTFLPWGSFFFFVESSQVYSEGRQCECCQLYGHFWIPSHCKNVIMFGVGSEILNNSVITISSSKIVSLVGECSE